MGSIEVIKYGGAVMDGRDKIDYLESIKIQQYKTEIGFRTLVESVNENFYIIPKYQRRYRWTKEQVAELVYSLVMGYPIPPIYTFRNKDNQLEILDGQQRIISLFFYYIGKYMNVRKNNSINFYNLNVENKSFKEALLEQCKLENLKIEITDDEGRTIKLDYNLLPAEVKRRVDYIPITVIEIKLDKGLDREIALTKIFANLNRGGSLLSAQEQRNGIYTCGFYDMLMEFNQDNTKWRGIWGKEDSKCKDVETLLRFCALKKYVYVENDNFVIQNYKGKYGEMLEKFSKIAMNFEKQEIEKYRKSLEQFVSLFLEDFVFGSKVALLESLYIVFEKKQIKKKITKKMRKEIMDSEKFKEYARQGMVGKSMINGRWKAVYEILSEYVE